MIIYIGQAKVIWADCVLPCYPPWLE